MEAITKGRFAVILGASLCLVITPAAAQELDSSTAPVAGDRSVEESTIPIPAVGGVERSSDETEGQPEGFVDNEWEDWEEGFTPEEELRDYVSVSTKYTQPSIETPASVSVISRDQIARAGYRSVGEALSSMAGIYVSHDLVNYHVGLRGAFGGARAGSRLLKVMVDGMPVPFSQAETYLLGSEFIPMSAIERIEILRGPASALYGAGAYSGAINVVTRRSPYMGETTVGGNINAIGGAGGHTMGGLDAMGEVTSEQSQVLVAGSMFYEDRTGLSVPNTGAFGSNTVRGVSGSDIARPFAAFGKMDQRVAGGRLSARALVQGHNRHASFHDLAPLGNTYVSMSNWRVMGGYERGFGDGWTVEGGIGLSGASPTTADRFQENESLFYLKRNWSSSQILANMEVRRDFEVGGFMLFGIDGFTGTEEMPLVMEYVAETNVLQDTRLGGEKYSITGTGAFTQVVFPIGDILNLAASARGDFHSELDNLVQGAGRFALVTTFSDRYAFKLIGGSSYKAPSPEQLYARNLVNQNDITGARLGGYDLESQYLYGGEAVVEAYPTTWSKVSLSAFYNLYLDTIGYQLESNTLTARNYDATNLGAEATGRVFYRIGQDSFVDASTSLSYQTTTVETFLTSLGQEDQLFPDNEIVPTLMVKARLGANIAPAYSLLSAEVHYIGERVPSQSNLVQAGDTSMVSPSYTLAPYTMLNVAYSTTTLQFGLPFGVAMMLKAENLLDSRHAEIGFNGVDVPSLGRTVWGRLTFSM